MVCRAMLVLESSHDGLSTFAYFNQNSETTGNSYVNKFTKQTQQTDLDWV